MIISKKESKVNLSALIGIGYWGEVHLKYLKSIKGIFLKYIYYKNNYPTNKIKNTKKYIITNKLHEIAADSSVRYINIVSPIETHTSLVIYFLKNKKNILVEKPLLMNKKQQNDISRLLQINKKKLIVSYPYLFSKTLLFAKKIFISKSFGNLEYIEINLKQCGRFMKYDVNFLLAPHAISILSMFYDIKNIKYNLNKIITNKNNTETALITCSIKSKIVASINLSLNYSSNENKKIINLFFKKGMVICDLNNQKDTLKSFQYLRMKKNNYQIAKIKNYINKFFDEKNNMESVIKDFYFSKYNLLNFELTKNINNFFKNV